MGFNSAFKGLMLHTACTKECLSEGCYWCACN